MRIGAGQVSLFARFSNMYGEIVGADNRAAGQSADRHPRQTTTCTITPSRPAPRPTLIPTEFERSFGVFGPPDYVVQRLGELIEIGIDRFIFRGSPLDPSNPDTESSVRFTQEVIPQLKQR